MGDYSALSKRPAREAGVIQECDADHFIASQADVGLDMNTLVTDIQRRSPAYTDSGAKEFNVQLTRNTPIVSVFHRQSSSCTMSLVSMGEYSE
jgi:hypothetical protein